MDPQFLCYSIKSKPKLLYQIEQRYISLVTRKKIKTPPSTNNEQDSYHCHFFRNIRKDKKRYQIIVLLAIRFVPPGVVCKLLIVKGL